MSGPQSLYIPLELLQMDLRQYLTHLRDTGESMPSIQIKVSRPREQTNTYFRSIHRWIFYMFVSHSIPLVFISLASSSPVSFLVCRPKNYAYQILDALAYCHARQIVHRDIKPKNLLIDERGTLKLADFGLARETSAPHDLYTYEVVTPWYRPPELMFGSYYYGAGVDIW